MTNTTSNLKFWWKALDRILRGEATRPENLGPRGLDLPTSGLIVVVLILAAATGACIGSYALFTPGHQGWILQWISSTVKVPLLFALTLGITFPSLYVSNALIGSRLQIDSLLRLLIAALSVNVTVLASLGPIVAFFGVSTNSYPFIVVLNVLVFALSGFLGMVFLTQTLNRMSKIPPTPIVAEEVSEDIGEHAGVDDAGEVATAGESTQSN